jgi:hypothetical protein
MTSGDAALLLADEAEDWAEGKAAVELPAAAGRAIAFILRPQSRGVIASATQELSARGDRRQGGRHCCCPVGEPLVARVGADIVTPPHPQTRHEAENFRGGRSGLGGSDQLSWRIRVAVSEQIHSSAIRPSVTR